MIDVTLQNFETEVMLASSQVPVLVDIWAEWCGPCKQLGPVLEQLEAEYAGRFVLAKLDADKVKEIAGQLSQMFGVRSIPFCVLFKDGQPVDGFAGIQPESAIRAMLEPHVSIPDDTGNSDDSAEDVEASVSALLEAGQPEQAISLLQQAMAEETSDPLLLLLARALVDTRQYDDAETVLNSIQDQDSHKQAIAGLRAGLGFARQTVDLPEVAELQQRLASNPADSEARYQLAIRQLARGQHEAALQGLLQLMQSDRSYADNSPQRTLLQAFEVLGNDHPLSIGYRRRLYQLLY